MLRSYKLGELTYKEVEEAIKQGYSKLILPIGTLEAHGPHLPLDTDTIIPLDVAIAIAPKIKALIAPPIHYGITSSLLGFPGGASVSEKTLEIALKEIVLSFNRHGFEIFIILNGHGGNRNAIKNALRDLWVNYRIKSVSIDWWIYASIITKEVYGEQGAHAGVDETAMILAKHPEIVKANLYDESEIYFHREGIRVYPDPGSILIYNEDEGKPKFDESKAKDYFEKVVNFIEKNLEKILEKIQVR